MEEKKKVFPWKKVAIVVVIILLVVAMSPLFWTNILAESLYDKVVYRDSKNSSITNYEDRVIITIKKEYWEEYEEEKFTKYSFKWNNVDRVEYADWLGEKTKRTSDDYDSMNYPVMTVYLKESGEVAIRKAMARLSVLNFVYLVSQCHTL